MRFVIQRVTHGSVTIDHKIKGEIGTGFVVLIGICAEDNEKIADAMVKKMSGLRIFADENGKTNLSLKDVGGSLLLISQFTLYADCKKGNRPSFVHAGAPDMANRLYEYIVEQSRLYVDNVQTGEFGADMAVEISNDGPFTIVLDSDEIL